MQTLASAAPLHNIAHAECMSPTAKPIKVFDEFHAFGSPVSNFQNGKQLLEKKCDAFGLSTPMPMMEAQLFSDSLSTAAPSPAMTNLSSAWTTPSSFDNTNTPCIVDCAPLLEAHLKLDGMGAPSCHAPSALQFGDSGMISCIEKMCKDMIFAPSSGRNFGIGFGLHDNPGNLLPPWPIMPSPPPLEQNTAAGMPRKNSESAALETPQIWHCSRTTPPAPKAAELPPLLLALFKDSIDSVRRALEQDPDAAKSLFWEHDVEPPLCTAVRCGCSPEIVGLLLEHQADVNGVDKHGRTPLAILASCSAQSCCQGSSFCDSMSVTSQGDALGAEHTAVEKLLIQAGAHQNHVCVSEARNQEIGKFHRSMETRPQWPSNMDADLSALLQFIHSGVAMGHSVQLPAATAAQVW